MKRKFGFNIPPLKIPSRSENNALRKALEGNFSYQSPPSSPLVDRPILPWVVLDELREACARIVQDTGNAAKESKPTESVLKLAQRTRAGREEGKMQDSKPARVDSKPSHRSVKSEHSGSHAVQLTHKPEDKPKDTPNGVEHHTKVPLQNTSQAPVYPRRQDSLSHGPHSQYSRPAPCTSFSVASTMERPRTAPIDSSVATPLTASTDRYHNIVSTAITSAVLTPGRSPLPAQDQAIHEKESYQAAIAQADNHVTESMRQQKHRSNLSDVVPIQPRPSRSMKRGRSFTSEVRDFVRSGSRSRPSSSHRDSDVTSSSSQGWRSWGLRRQSSKSSLVDTAATDLSNGLKRSGTSATKPEVDLNRDLPPLPRLDTYYKETSEAAHISTIMRTDARTDSPALKLSKLNTDPKKIFSHKPSNSVGTDITSPLYPPSRKISIAYSKTSSQDSCFSPSTSSVNPERHIDLMKAATLARSTENLRQLMETAKSMPQSKLDTTSAAAAPPAGKSSTKSIYSIMPPHRRAPSQPILRSTSASSSVLNLPPRPATRDATSSASGSRNMLPPNFSRKIKLDMEAEEQERLARKDSGASIIEITALPPMPARKRPSGLRRVLSSLGGGNKNENNSMRAAWMNRMEE